MTNSTLIRVCYVVHYTGGGSMESLERMVAGLDRNIFDPWVVFHRVKDQSVVDRLEAMQVPVTSLSKPQPRSSNAASMNVSGWLAESDRRQKLLGVYKLAKSTREFVSRDTKWLNPLYQFFRRQPFDLVHFNNGLRHHRADLFVTQLLKIPALCHVRNFQTLSPLERAAGKSVNKFLYMSRALAESYEVQQISPDRGIVVHDQVTLPPPMSQADKDAKRMEFGIDKNHFMLVNVGRLVSWKGQDVFIKALHRLRKAIPTLRALIVGKPDDNPISHAYAEGLRQLVEQYGLTENVIFTGFRTDIFELMAASNVVIHSATTPEPFGLVIIEALASGTPLIATKAGGIIDILTPETGLMVTPGHDIELADALKQLYDAPHLRAKLAKAGRTHVQKEFGKDVFMRRIYDVYNRALNIKTLTAVN